VPHDRLSADVLAWGDRHRRDLPWRRTRDPWAVLVAEVMLQQTQVARVVPRWEAFLDELPTPAVCASEPLAAVLERWQGLGYPRRGRNLWLAAQRCVERHEGRLPDTLPELLDLPGVGPYTARAVLVFALEQPVGVVDTNIARVLARVAGERLTPRRAQAAADAWVPPEASWAWNQTLMDVGASCCRPSVPQCGQCPLRRHCAWHLGGCPEPDPAVGTAGASGRQARFAGSDRQGRGRLMAAMARGPLAVADVASTAGWAGDPARAERVAEALVEEGLATRIDGHYLLG
jgi:A/G-specific adenine glycosylase